MKHTSIIVLLLGTALICQAHTLDSVHARHRRSHSLQSCAFTRSRPKYSLTCPRAGLTPNPGATVVTSYLNTPSKRPADVYLQRMNTFMQLKASVVAYIDYAYVNTAEQMARHRDDMIIVPVTFAQFRTLSCGLDMWRREHANDVEKDVHTPTLYPVWAEKATMVATAARANCFQSQFFIWLDVGYFSETPVPVQPFPVARGLASLQPGKVLLLAVDKHTIKRVQQTHMKHGRVASGVGNSENIVTIGGGGFAGDVKAVTAWEGAYIKMLDTYRANGWFIGKDQNLFVSICLETPQLCTLHDANKRWYDLIPLLTGEMQLDEWKPYGG